MIMCNKHANLKNLLVCLRFNIFIYVLIINLARAFFYSVHIPRLDETVLLESNK